MSSIKATSHLLFYSFAFGGTTFYSYFASPIAFKVLEREQFSKLQNNIFPYFFQLEAISPLILALTSPFSLTQGPIITLTMATLSGLTNLCWLLPWTRSIKEERKDIAENFKIDKDLKKFEKLDAPLKKEFGKSHGLSLLMNMTHTLSLLAYGVLFSRGIFKYVPK
ncbi:Tmh18p NDAI_0A04900 [Naumovozyma dairenensis CBS 421]|uniref:TMEM205-like domain-containing protein n=1 Tax=Naumovozyma dairenensis (strain ATCC 10597 / BCRC 20456 / CBS 421 / NBRC 0211 / NRRL Y-12639) TaxID=1071378 RepID=G0W4A7_NAUDC|nr:hypothetical protein NDAI_0A04900 [Naumovozyma dairenensis CBS 421]CCD22645.1 hypothetical protein NDAI_0A04900 [Naumovozyma dairenensis CBS 421]